MDILDDMGVSNLSAKVFFVFVFLKNYSFNLYIIIQFLKTENRRSSSISFGMKSSNIWCKGAIKPCEHYAPVDLEAEVFV